MRYVIYSPRVWNRTYVLHHKHHGLQVIALRLYSSIEHILAIFDVSHVKAELLLVHLSIKHELLHPSVYLQM